MALLLNAFAGAPAYADASPTSAAYVALIASAQSSASTDDPATALAYYERALQAATSDEQQRIALFGIARMHVWLGQYRDAERAYRSLLRFALPVDDRAVALAGLVESLTDEGRPIAAYDAATAGFSARSAVMVVQAARAAEAAGHPAQAQRMLLDGAPSLVDVVPASRLGILLGGVRHDVRDDLAPYAAAAVDGSHDSDGFTTRSSTFSAGARVTGDAVVHAVIGSTRFAQNGWTATGALASVGVDAWIARSARLTATVGTAAYPAFHTGTFSADLTVRPNDSFGFDAFASRDVVQSQFALQQGLAATVAGIAADHTLGSRSSVAASFSRQRFDDGNARPNLTAALGTTLSDQAGLSARLRWRSFTDSAPGATAYFDPQRYTETALLVSEVHRFPGASAWRVHLTAGIGRQNVVPGGASTTASYEAAVDGRIGDRSRVDAAFGYSNSALAASSGYQRRYGSLGLRFSL